MAHQQAKFRETFTHGELLAIDRRALDLVFTVKPSLKNKMDGPLCIVYVNGPLEHHPHAMFDSYDDILERLEEGIECEETKAVVMMFDSPGGDANGVVEAHRKIKRLMAKYGKPIYAYSNESMFSAAYGLGSACKEIWMPETASVGSVGVIATLVDTSKKLAMEGTRVEFITTGKRKADLRPERPLTDDIMATVQEAVDEMAEVFFGTVGKTRTLSIEQIYKLQAGRFMGKRGVKVGLADGLASWDKFVRLVKSLVGLPSSEHEGSGQVLTPSPQEKPMATLLSLIATKDEALKALAAAATPAEKKKALSALEEAMGKIAAKTVKKIEHKEHVETDDDNDSDEEESEEEESEEEDERYHADDDGDDDDSDDDGDGDDDEDDEEDEEEDEEKAATAFASSKSAPTKLFKMLQKLTGKKGVSEVIGSVEALGARVKNAEEVEKRLGKLETSSRREKVTGMLSDARKAGKITKKQIEPLKAQGMKDPKWLRGYLSSLPKMVRAQEDQVLPAPLDAANGRPMGMPSVNDQLAALSGSSALTPDQRRILANATANVPPEQSEEYGKIAAQVAPKYQNGVPVSGKPRI